jgi:hypothetical protein
MRWPRLLDLDSCLMLLGSPMRMSNQNNRVDEPMHAGKHRERSASVNCRHPLRIWGRVWYCRRAFVWIASFSIQEHNILISDLTGAARTCTVSNKLTKFCSLFKLADALSHAFAACVLPWLPPATVYAAHDGHCYNFASLAQSIFSGNGS